MIFVAGIIPIPIPHSAVFYLSLAPDGQAGPGPGPRLPSYGPGLNFPISYSNPYTPTPPMGLGKDPPLQFYSPSLLPRERIHAKQKSTMLLFLSKLHFKIGRYSYIILNHKLGHEFCMILNLKLGRDFKSNIES